MAKEKEWKHSGTKTIREAVDKNTNGKAAEFLCDTTQEYAIQNLDRMAARLTELAKSNAKISIVGDYDADGVCSTAEMLLALSELGATNISVCLPKRLSQGYGLKKVMVDGIKEGALVAVDNGISAIDAITAAKEKGLEVLVIDHHLPVKEGDSIVLPPADFIVDPNVDDELISKGIAIESTFRGYCAAGLVYKIAQKMIPGTHTLKVISSFAGIATVADVVPLLKENRIIYSEGINNILQGNTTEGMKALVKTLYSDGHVSEKDIGFRIAPMLNAPGRIYDDGANMSLQTLMCEDEQQAAALVRQLNEVNDFRKREKDRSVNRAFRMIEEQDMAGDNPIVVIDPETQEGIVGLVSGAITEAYNASSFVLTEHGNSDSYKGSGRAAEGDNLKDALDKTNAEDPDVFINYGGHAAAAGITIRKEKADAFKKLMSAALGAAKPAPDYIEYDLELTADQVLPAAYELDQFRPFGQDNPELIFRINGFKLSPIGNAFYQKMGGDSIRFRGAGCEAVGFSMLNDYIDMGEPKEIDIVGTLGFHYSYGQCVPQIEIIDMAPSAPEKTNRTSSLNTSIMDVLKQNSLA